MAILRSLLAMYGAFDQVAVQTQDPEMRAMVEKLLPGTTGPGQRGWYKEIQDFVRRNAPNEAAAEFPPLQDAMRELTGAAGFEGVPAQMSSRDVGRLFQASLGLGVLKSSQPARSNPVPVLEQVDMEWFDAVFAMAATPEGPRTGSEPPPSGITGVQLPQMLDDFTDKGLEAWTPRIQEAAEANQVAHDVAAIPPIKAIGESIGPQLKTEITENGVTREVTDQGKVTSEVIQVDGVLCALLTTEFTRTPYDINTVKGIIDPLNWDNANKFFAEMTAKGTAADGRSSQILEEVSTDPGLYRIKTHLKYVKEERPGDNFVINYDFADSRGEDDSMQVRVDSGYIVLCPTADGKGTRVLTSKMVAIDGLSPTAVAIFAHAMGWLAIGEMMMFGDPVNDPDDPIVPWTKSPDPTALIPTTRQSPEETEPVQLPPQPVSLILVKEAIKAVADYIDIASKETAVVADKWVNGGLSVKDMLGHSQKLGGKLASEPFRILDRMMKEVAARPSDETPADQVRGGGSP